MILGNTRGDPHDLAVGELYVRQIHVPGDPVQLGAFSALLDGQGSGAGSGSAVVYPALYDETGELLATGPGVTIASGEDPSWRPLRLDVSAVRLAGVPWLGLRASGADNAARLYGLVGTGAVAKTAPAPDLVPADLSAASDSTLDAALFVDTFDAYKVPDVDDASLARLPWTLTQRFLGSAGALSSTRQSAVAGWHGATTDPEQGANAIVRSDGPLAELVGERLRITYRRGTLARSVAVYVHDEQDFPPEVADEDISLARDAFMRLAPLATNSLPVEVAVVA
jgi:hypothetical protein